MTTIYIAQHKPYRAVSESGYVPIQVGAAGKAAILECRDDQGENISQKNPSFCELTALYWMWKNSDADILGLVHYRRHFASNKKSKDPWQRIVSIREIEAHLKNADIILPRKRNYIIETNYSQYVHAHHEKDLLLTRQIIVTLAPEYVEAFDLVMSRRSGHRFNMFITERELMDDYCVWLFPILFELEKRIDTTNYDAYNRRVIGFLAERLLDVWLENQNLKIVELPVMDMEPVNWINKGASFVIRKFTGRKRTN